MSLTRLTAPSQATESATLTLPWIHFYPHTPLQNDFVAVCEGTIVPVDVIQQRMCHLFAFACMCAH